MMPLRRPASNMGGRRFRHTTVFLIVEDDQAQGPAFAHDAFLV
jgi:hypothetical protein